MSQSTPEGYEVSESWGRRIFGRAKLGDERRTQRLVETFDRMQRHPGGTWPAKLPVPADLRGFYRSCDSRRVTHDAVIQASREQVLKRIDAVAGPVLIRHDATELDYTTLSSLCDDLGQIGTGSRCGYVCHNSLAVSAESGEVLGLIGQILHCRDEVPPDETSAEHRDRETRESLLWVSGTQSLPADRRFTATNRCRCTWCW
jgi:hypothetical protein